MEIDANFRLMFVSVGTYDQAKCIAEVLISHKLAACCSIISGIESIYSWNDSIMCEKEYLLKIKTFDHAIDNIEQCIKQIHSYTIPEMIVIPIEGIYGPYLQWAKEQVIKD
jgi:periplasmic divalent cation tolerance protein